MTYFYKVGLSHDFHPEQNTGAFDSPDGLEPERWREFFLKPQRIGAAYRQWSSQRWGGDSQLVMIQ